MTDDRAVASTETERLRRLLVSSTRLTEEALELARALGPEVSGRIVAEVIDAPLTRSPPGSAMRAAHLARELGLVAAVDPLVRFFERTGLRFPVGETVLSVLARFGCAGAGAMLGLLERSRAEDRSRIAGVLARVDADDERIRAQLVGMLAKAPGFAAPLLAQRGDWRAVPDLVRALETLSRRPVADCDICAADDLSAIGRAVVALGGYLSEEHSALIDEAFERTAHLWTEVDDDPFEDDLPPRTPAVRLPRPGRNDPCPCGSGKKHKRCCLDADRGNPRH